MSLLALMCLLLGVATTLALQHFLLTRLDSQLVAAGGLSSDAGRAQPDSDGAAAGTAGSGDGNGQRTDTGARFLLGPGHPPGTLGARVVGGRVTALGRLSADGTLQNLPASQGSGLAGLAADGHPQTRSVPGLGSFRLLATLTPDGDVLVTGLPLREVNDTLLQLAAAESAVAVVALLGAAATAAVIVRRALRPLRRVAATAARVSTLPLGRGEVDLAERVPAADTDPRTEVGQVGAALNRLLDHVGAALRARQASEMQVRQFVADASHELRTPLAAIRGYAEVTRRSREAAPPDLAYAMGRVESETARMTALVEDLLLLARLDTGRPLDAEPVDLSRLLIDAVSDASAAGPDHDWRLDLPDEPVMLTGDAARLHQVAANLLANARTHTPAGTTVTGRVTASHTGPVQLTVEDDGPGVTDGLLPRVFDRFARGEAARTRGAGSTGLGLSIVQAIVTAHAGRVSVDSRPGRTAFVVELPRPPDTALARLTADT